MELNREQADFAKHCVSRWISIYNKNHSKLPNEHDADHSALLLRLLSGKEPLDKPPPLRHSYPAYDLAEGAPVEIFEINEVHFEGYEDGEWSSYPICIDQHIGWRW
jgi:hypothetical protein